MCVRPQRGQIPKFRDRNQDIINWYDSDGVELYYHNLFSIPKFRDMKPLVSRVAISKKSFSNMANFSEGTQ